MRTEEVFVEEGTVEIRGHGLSSERECRVLLRRGGAGAGLRVFLDQLDSPWWVQKIPRDFSVFAERTTVLDGHGRRLRGIEHLMAALILWPRADVDVWISGGELPILDGSPEPWTRALRRLLGEPTGIALRECLVSGSWNWPGGSAFFEPHPECLCVELILDALPGQSGAVSFYAGDHCGQVMCARTFILENDYRDALKAGLLAGARSDNGVLLRRAGDALIPVVGAPLRHPREPFWHKIADLLGDLALLGRVLPKLSIRIRNGGHVAHHQIAERIRHVLD